MADRIVISFDDENNGFEGKKEKETGKIDLSSGFKINEEPPAEDIRKNLEQEKILQSELTCLNKSNNEHNSYYISDMLYPSGVDKGFNLNYSVDLNDEFFNSIIFNNRYFVLTSAASKIYLINRFDPQSQVSFFVENQKFEKSGLVFKNDIYVNSLHNISYIQDKDILGQDDLKIIYNSPAHNYIWTNLSYIDNKLAFVEFNVSDSTSTLKLIDKDCGKSEYEYSLKINRYLYENIFIRGNKIFLVADNSIIVFSFGKDNKAVIDILNINFEVNLETQIVVIKNRLFLSNKSGEIFYFDLDKIPSAAHFSGIKCSYLNSMAGFDNYLFTGHIGGWKVFNTNGSLLYSHNDIDENKIEAISKNILVVSKYNKIFFHNLNRFQEAEGFAIIPEKNDNARIISSVISFNNIYLLTKNGIFESYSNERLNIHL